MATKRSTKAPANPYLTTADPNELEPANRVAYDVIHERRDLLPSVRMIMDAALDDDAKLQAMTRFRDSLTATGDPHRDPRVAITSVGGVLPTA